jgi:hypothetical protein
MAMDQVRKRYPSQSELLRILSYDRVNGDLMWRARNSEDFQSHGDAVRWNARFAGKVAGSISKTKGYRSIRIGFAGYMAHVVAWIIAYGCAPSGEIDHINGIRSDNRAENLRDVSRSENLRNAAKRARNTSGVVGVYWNKQANKWHGQVSAPDGRVISIGYYADIADAAHARKQAEAMHGYHANHGRALV